MATSFDYIVVGGGVAGLTLASRLSQLLPDQSITVLEAGDDPTVNEHVLTPAGYRFLQTSDQAWTIPCATNPNLDNRQTAVCVGKALSGSAAINAGAWTRGPSSSYDLWADTLGDPMWSYEALLPYFKLTEVDLNPGATSGQHGTQGKHTVTSLKAQHPERYYPLRNTVMQAFIEAGIKYNSDPNDGRPNGLSENIETWLRGRRQLPSLLLDLSRVTVRANSTVQRVILSDAATPRATGIELLDGTIINAKREVILSAGTYHTPQLLMLSGVGASDHLRTHSISPRVHNPGVGANLADHLGLTLTLQLHPSVAEKGVALMHPSFLSKPTFLNGNPLDFIHFNTLSTDTQQATLRQLNPHPSDAAHVCEPNATHYESIVSYMPFPSAITGIPDQTPDAAAKGNLITTTAIVLTTTSRGRVGLGSATPTDPPYVESNGFATDSDRYILREAVRRAVGIWTETPTGQATVAGEVVPDGFEAILPQTSDEAINSRIRRFAYGLDHPMGTCRMAKRPGWEGDDGGVVDSHGRVFGVEGLRVVDGSVLPVPIAAHIQAAVYALAERMAVVVAESHKGTL